MTGYVFVCYALEGEHLGALRERLELITLGARDAGLRTFAHIRDEQDWRIGEVSMRQILKVAFERIAGADAVLLDLTTSAGSKRVGLNIEAGYAKALEKPILALWHESDRPNMTTDLADHEASYRSNDDLRSAARRLLSQVKWQSPTRI
ncbi:hypothetical protein GCM10023085_26770 [Actinomadura viridis]|uniref:Nucleoside 2-deoxyribosyltransferase n=1 Tax=Actinomadura viridis TaxID=58110 RepID=A0A931GLD0_9ACTN|nr:nucleoside 2-deoxyribosyltransferase [Actinomadura viridis]MBG6087336.1 nucleoside 2-deoxyribosyltransferase [Actinomadura viridis]